MRRRRLPVRSGTALVPSGGALAHYVPGAPASDLRYLEQVVTIPFPIRSAVTYLQRNMANKVTYRLVEARRGETVGTVREIEIHHADSGERTTVRGQRVLANGEPASFYVPDQLVTVRAQVDGAGRSGNLASADEVVLHVPVRGYLRFLPAVFQGEGPVHSREIIRARATEVDKYRGRELPDLEAIELDPDEDPLRRYLFLFQHVMTTVTQRIDRLVDLTDPMSCESKFLPWLSSWVGFELDESLPVHQQRELVRRAIRLMRTRATRSGIEEMVRVLTSAPVRVEERVVPKPALLGKCVLLGGTTVVERYKRGEPTGHYLMAETNRRPTRFFSLRLEPRERFQNRFGERAGHVLMRIVNVVSRERPDHVWFTIRFDDRNR